MSKKYHIIIAVISITVTIALGILSTQKSDFVKVQTNTENGDTTESSSKVFLRDAVISITCGSSIYVVLYRIPKEYQMLEEKKKQENEEE